MKHLIVSLTISACMLLPSAGVVFADNPHPGGPVMGSGGQLGTFGGVSGVASCGGTQTSPPGQVSNLTTNSPFPAGSGMPPTPNPGSAVSKYAGAGSGNYGAGKEIPGVTPTPNPHANSQYDNACLRQVP